VAEEKVEIIINRNRGGYRMMDLYLGRRGPLYRKKLMYAVV
jgi:hypothetical protein